MPKCSNCLCECYPEELKKVRRFRRIIKVCKSCLASMRDTSVADYLAEKIKENKNVKDYSGK